MSETSCRSQVLPLYDFLQHCCWPCSSVYLCLDGWYMCWHPDVSDRLWMHATTPLMPGSCTLSPRRRVSLLAVWRCITQTPCIGQQRVRAARDHAARLLLNSDRAQNCVQRATARSRAGPEQTKPSQQNCSCLHRVRPIERQHLGACKRVPGAFVPRSACVEVCP